MNILKRFLLLVILVLVMVPFTILEIIVRAAFWIIRGYPFSEIPWFITGTAFLFEKLDCK